MFSLFPTSPLLHVSHTNVHTGVDRWLKPTPMCQTHLNLLSFIEQRVSGQLGHIYIRFQLTVPGVFIVALLPSCHTKLCLAKS